MSLNPLTILHFELFQKSSTARKKISGELFIDFRALNEKVIGDAYPLPNITDILDHLGNAQYFSVFDLASGFDQVETHPDDRSKTAFSNFKYQRMLIEIKH